MMNSLSTVENSCHICGSATIQVMPAFMELCRVTSDCRPWPRGGELAVCDRCGTAQKCVHETWRKETEWIYADYVMYQQGGGEEQRVFDLGSGQSTARSQRLIQYVRESVPLTETGRLLDFGCGNGAVLRAFSSMEPGWTLYGLEQGDRYRESVEAIPRVEAMVVGALDRVPGTFDAITMLHVLEHIESPIDFLMNLRGKIDDGGLLVVDLPNFSDNPFDLLIADHCTHFSVDTLRGVVERAGFEIVAISSDWIPKEISMVARKLDIRSDTVPPPHVSDVSTRDTLLACMRWLHEIVDWSRRAREKDRVGIFGTSIAAAWMFAELDGKVDFFVDEDPNRVGTQHRERPVYSPDEVPADTHVLLPLAPCVARKVLERLAQEHGDVNWLLPPEFALPEGPRPH